MKDRSQKIENLEDSVDDSRRIALRRLGLGLAAAYAVPALLTLSKPAFASGGSSGNSGSGGGSSGGSGASSGSGASGSSGPSDSSGSGSDGFGGVEQAGPDLSKDQEQAAIDGGWE